MNRSIAASEKNEVFQADCKSDLCHGNKSTVVKSNWLIRCVACGDVMTLHEFNRQKQSFERLRGFSYVL